MPGSVRASGGRCVTLQRSALPDAQLTRAYLVDCPKMTSSSSSPCHHNRSHHHWKYQSSLRHCHHYHDHQQYQIMKTGWTGGTEVRWKHCKVAAIVAKRQCDRNNNGWVGGALTTLEHICCHFGSSVKLVLVFSAGRRK